MRNITLTIACLIVASCAPATDSFGLQASFISARSSPAYAARPVLFNQNNDEMVDPLSEQQQQQQQQPSEAEIFMEKASREGANRIRQISIEERTKRAMMAEAVEDRIFALTDDLEDLIEKDGTVQVQNRDQVVVLAKQIKASQEQYENLVSGKASVLLDSMADDSGTTASSKDKKSEDKDPKME